jgi:hypothetical protein
MITLVLQSVCTLLLGAFAVLALRAARRLRSTPGDSPAGWKVAGVVFAVYVVDKALQEVFGIAAYFGGPEAPVYDVYMRLATMADHSRTFLIFALYGTLLALPFRHRLGRRAPALFAAAIVAMLVAGALLGWVEGPFTPRHLALTAQIDVAGFIALGTTLLFLMLKSDVDRLLWFSIALYGFTSVLGVLFLSVLAWVGSGSWTPAPWTMQFMRCIFAALMVTLAASRYRAAARGRQVRPMLEPFRVQVRTM